MKHIALTVIVVLWALGAHASRKPPTPAGSYDEQRKCAFSQFRGLQLAGQPAKPGSVKSH
jgi:hypothetical protein